MVEQLKLEASVERIKVKKVTGALTWNLLIWYSMNMYFYENSRTSASLASTDVLMSTSF